jgi:sortase A
VKRLGSAFSLLLGAWRSRPLSRNLLWVFAIVLGLSGIGLLVYAPITDFISDREQSRLAREFRSPQFRGRTSTSEIAPGQVVVRLVIPTISLDALVVEGTDPRSLRAGAGRYTSTALPCQPGNVGIAGHRNIYGSPFLRLDELKPGDRINLITPDRTCSYEVVTGPTEKKRPKIGAAGWITGPNDNTPIAPLKEPMLTLTTCHPKNRASSRLIIRAKLLA